jgi:hypothetical protein
MKAKEAINANEKKLTPEQQEIKGFVDERNIIRLIHFTRYENLESILTNGLITRDGLNGFNHTVYVNDSLRLDGHTNSISLSLSFPLNRKFLYLIFLNLLRYVYKMHIHNPIKPLDLWQVLFENIPTKYILAVGFENQKLLLQVNNQQDSSHIKFVMAEKYFNERGYVR